MVSAIQSVSAAMNVQIGFPGAAVDPAISDDGGEPRRCLYIVARGGRTLVAADIFAAMRRDMTNASVELIYDRRVTERRSEPSSVNQDRRTSDRRDVDRVKEISAVGWARIEVE